MKRDLRAAVVGILSLAFAIVTVTPAFGTSSTPTQSHILPAASTLSPGMKGTAVLALQHKLIRTGHLPSNGNTGAYDTRTKDAVTRIQRAYGHPVTGQATSATQATINELDRQMREKNPPGTLRPGMRSTAVRDLQRKLFRIGYLTAIPTGYYGDATRSAVYRLQQAYRHKHVTGWATPATMNTINAAVRKVLNTPVQKGSVVPGMYGQGVTNVQNKLIYLGYMPRGSNHGWYNPATKTAVANYQRAAGLRQTGIADAGTSRSLNTSISRVRTQANNRKLDARCLTGRAICIDKTARKVYWIVNGKVLRTLDARFARPGYSTPNGAFTVQRKIYLDVSRRYENAKMPFSIYYQGGRAVHYSYGFAAQGYNGGSHGCVNLRDWNGAKWLYNQARVGDKVIVYSR